MAARPRYRRQQIDNGPPPLCAYEAEREARIACNKAKLAALGILEQRSLLEASFRVRKRVESQRKDKPATNPLRASARLRGIEPSYKGVEHSDSEPGEKIPELCGPSLEEQRCNSQARGSIYDSKTGVTCHFCRQKKLCGEAGCPRCSQRNPELQCIGKSECTRCASSSGRFCRACLLIRYGAKLEDVRTSMANGSWLCPHCYEADYPSEAWICNSSICMVRRGLKPTGIAIYDAKHSGFPSVAHFLQAKLLQQPSYMKPTTA